MTSFSLGQVEIVTSISACFHAEPLVCSFAQRVLLSCLLRASLRFAGRLYSLCAVSLGACVVSSLCLL